MSQFNFGAIDPDNTDGTELAAILGQWRDALHSSHKGPAAPTYAVEGMGWLDDSTTPWALKKCTAVTPGVAWVVVGTIDPAGPTFTPASHTHAIANVTGLQSALDGKLATTAQAADSDKLDGMQPSAAATANSIAQRDVNGDLVARYMWATLFNGTATSARYA